VIRHFATEPVLTADELSERVGLEGCFLMGRRLVSMVVFGALWMGCSAKRATVVLSLQEISCQSCGGQSVNGLTSTAGVYDATFDLTTAEIRVEFDDEQTNPQALVSVVEELGFEVELGGGHGRYVKEVSYPEGVDVAWISRGEAVSLTDNIVEGKVTVFDFYAEWCGPCRLVDRVLIGVLRDHQDVAVRKIDIVDWESEVTGQHLSDVSGLPYVIVYDKRGEWLQSISGLDLDALSLAIQNGRSQ